MTELQEFECKFCHMICSNKAGLTRHLNRQHSEDIKAEDKDVEKALGISHESLRYEYLSDKDANYVYQEYPEMRNKNWCPTCDGKNENCDHELQRNLAKHYANAGIGMTYMRIGWKDFYGNEDVRKFCYRFMSNVKSFKENDMAMCLLGSNGIGKTTSVSLLFKDLVLMGYKPYFTTYQKLVTMLGDSFYNSEVKERYADKILRSPFLAIDDIGKSMSNRLTQTALDNVLRERVQASRPTFITSNMNTAEIFREYGRSSFSLIVETSVIFELQEQQDVRSKIKNEKYELAKAGIIKPIV